MNKNVFLDIKNLVNCVYALNNAINTDSEAYYLSMCNDITDDIYKKYGIAKYIHFDVNILRWVITDK